MTESTTTIREVALQLRNAYLRCKNTKGDDWDLEDELQEIVLDAVESGVLPTSVQDVLEDDADEEDIVCFEPMPIRAKWLTDDILDIDWPPGLEGYMTKQLGCEFIAFVKSDESVKIVRF